MDDKWSEKQFSVESQLLSQPLAGLLDHPTSV
jgi:hypothetical protein